MYFTEIDERETEARNFSVFPGVWMKRARGGGGGMSLLWGHSIIPFSLERFFPSNWRIVNSPPASTLTQMGGNKIAR